MTMVKSITFSPEAFGQPIAQIVKLSSRGLLGEDRTDFVKRASTDILRNIESLRDKVASDETLIHLLAMGATEDYGANRNGDGFRRCTCQTYHPTFEKYAMFYRNHDNKDPKKSYGRIIKSAWHDPMKRVELLVALNSNEVAARRNKGLVADQEMEKLAAGRDIPVSMACKVAYDICSYCGNKAPSVKDYCTGVYQGGMCKAGGLRDNIGALVEIDGGIHQLHADNPHPTFFDISHVIRPADRIAYVTGALEKTAAVSGRIIKSAELAQQFGISIPYALAIDGYQPQHVHRLVKLAYQLSDAEPTIADGTFNLSDHYATAFKPSVQGMDQPLELPPQFREKFSVAMRALADQKICLPLARFIEVVAEQPFEKAAEIATIVARELPGIYSRMITDTELPERVKASQYSPAEVTAPPRFAAWAQKMAEDLSLAESHVQRRVTRAALYQEAGTLRRSLGHEKIASVNDSAGRLAEEYALYQLAFLGSFTDSDPNLPLTANLVLLQNHAG